MKLHHPLLSPICRGNKYKRLDFPASFCVKATVEGDKSGGEELGEGCDVSHGLKRHHPLRKAIPGENVALAHLAYHLSTLESTFASNKNTLESWESYQGGK